MSSRYRMPAPSSYGGGPVPPLTLVTRHRAPDRHAGPAGRLGPLADGQDVPVEVLEPGSLDALDLGDPVDRLQPREVVLLEGHPAVTQLLDGLLDVVDVERQVRGLVRPGVLRGVDQH